MDWRGDDEPNDGKIMIMGRKAFQLNTTSIVTSTVTAPYQPVSL